MRHLLILLARPREVRAVVAESVLAKHQLLVVNRSRGHSRDSMYRMMSGRSEADENAAGKKQLPQNYRIKRWCAAKP